MEPYVREVNATEYIEYTEPVPTESQTEWNALISETAYTRFVHSAGQGNELDMDQALSITLDRLAYLDGDGRKRLDPSDIPGVDRDEILEIEKSLHVFVRGKDDLILEPRFKGCGFLSSCNGDLIVDSCLFEIKTVERRLRGRISSRL